MEKTRDAYRDQFNVGQRTLLDLLDTENELLSARRAAINADTDLTLAYVRTYAGMGVLSDVLGLKRPDLEVPDPQDLSSVAASESCIAEPVKATAIDRDALNARALALLDSNRTAFVPSAAYVVTPPAAPIPQTGLDTSAARRPRWPTRSRCGRRSSRARTLPGTRSSTRRTSRRMAASAAASGRRARRRASRRPARFRSACRT